MPSLLLSRVWVDTSILLIELGQLRTCRKEALQLTAFQSIYMSKKIIGPFCFFMLLLKKVGIWSTFSAAFDSDGVL